MPPVPRFAPRTGADGELVFNAYTKFVARQNGRFTKIVGMPADFTGYGIDDPQDIVDLNPALTFVEEPPRRLDSPLPLLMARWK